MATRLANPGCCLQPALAFCQFGSLQTPRKTEQQLQAPSPFPLCPPRSSPGKSRRRQARLATAALPAAWSRLQSIALRRPPPGLPPLQMRVQRASRLQQLQVGAGERLSCSITREFFEIPGLPSGLCKCPNLTAACGPASGPSDRSCYYLAPFSSSAGRGGRQFKVPSSIKK